MKSLPVLEPIKWDNCSLALLDQRDLPHKENYLVLNTLEECIEAIRQMVVRGAPCIGYTGIYAMALWVKNHPQASLKELENAAQTLIEARPTAVNLRFEVEHCLALAKTYAGEFSGLQQEFAALAQRKIAETNQKHLKMAQFAEEELDNLFGSRPLRLMTHCNTGYLACGALGTALGVVSHLASLERVEHVWVDETRPYLQGSRLTAYELSKQGIPFKVVVEGAASYLMKNNLVDAIFVGADRIVANGDTANKIGTSTLAIVARHYGIPFYVVAPLSSFDLSLNSGEEIEVELRDPNEILKLGSTSLGPVGAQAFNPSFDITSGELITGIICEKGLFKPDYHHSLQSLY